MSSSQPPSLTKHTSLRIPSSSKKLQKQPSAATLRPPRTAYSNNNSRNPSTTSLHPSPSTTTSALHPTTNQPQNANLSKRTSIASLRTLIPKKSHPKLSSPCTSISAPAPPQKLLRLSELLDPDDLIREEHQSTPANENATSPPHGASADFDAFPPTNAHTKKRLLVQSPSGQKLDAETFAARPDRPLTVSERQRRIREETVRRADEARREQLRVAVGGDRGAGGAGGGCCGVM